MRYKKAQDKNPSVQLPSQNFTVFLGVSIVIMGALALLLGLTATLRN